MPDAPDAAVRFVIFTQKTPDAPFARFAVDYPLGWRPHGLDKLCEDMTLRNHAVRAEKHTPGEVPVVLRTWTHDEVFGPSWVRRE